MSRKSTQKASMGRPAGKRALKDLTPRAARAIKGGVRRLKKVKDLPAKAVKAGQDRSVKGGAVYQHRQTDLEFLR